MLSWEFLAIMMLSTFVPCLLGTRGGRRLVQQSKVADHLKKEITKFYTRRVEVLALKGTTPQAASVQSGRRSSGSAKPSVDEDIPDYDEKL